MIKNKESEMNLFKEYQKFVKEYSFSHKIDSAHIEDIAWDFFKAGFKFGAKPITGCDPEPKKHNFSCSCGWLHLDVYPGFKCKICGSVFESVDKK